MTPTTTEPTTTTEPLLAERVARLEAALGALAVTVLGPNLAGAYRRDPALGQILERHIAAQAERDLARYGREGS